MSRSRFHAAFALVLTATIVPASLPISMSRALAGDKGPSKKDLDAARKSFMEGLDLEKAEQWHEARGKFEDVGKVRMTPEVRFHIALCEEHEGLLLEALRDFETAEADAKAENKQAVMKEAPEHAAAIKPRIPKVKVKVPTDVDNVTLTLDAMPLDPKNTDELVVNPGEHKIEATADKHQPFAYEFKLEEGESKTVVVKLAPLEDEKTEATPTPPVEEKPETEWHRKTPALAYIAGGVGIASLIAAGVFVGMRGSVKSDLDTSCPDLKCPSDKSDAINSGKTYTTLVNVFGILGVVAVGASVYLFVSAPKEEVQKPKEGAASLRLIPSAPGASLAGLSLSGAF